MRNVFVTCFAIASGCGGGGSSGSDPTYYIAADEVEWDYAPSGMNQISGMPFDDAANVYMQTASNRIGRRYIKALYREYTDATFSTLKPIAPEWEHLGMLGPLVRASVGDTIDFVFKNNTTRSYSVHPHGVFYDKSSEGTPYNDGTDGAAKDDDAVVPGAVYTYHWKVPERAGPGPADGTSAFWMYHSHTDEVSDVYAGLMGPMIITARGKAKADGAPVGVDREFVTVFFIDDENNSPYLDQNVQTYTGDPGSVNTDDDDFIESNKKHSINGFVFGNLPGLVMKQGEMVNWYLMAMGTETDLHTPHWHGNTVLANGFRTDVVGLLPATMVMAEMMPDDPGTWLYHCHVADHITAGMLALYTVTASAPSPSDSGQHAHH